MAKFCTNLEMEHQAEFNGIDNTLRKMSDQAQCLQNWLGSTRLELSKRYWLGVTNQGRYPNFGSKNDSKNFTKIGQKMFDQKIVKKFDPKVWPGKIV